MAFELGIDFGCRSFAEGDAKSKKILVLEKERYRYQRALSDLSGSDIKDHNNEPEVVVREVRNWFREMATGRPPSGTVIWDHFNVFMTDFYQASEEQGYKDKDLELMPTLEYRDLIEEWLQNKGIISSF